MTLGALQHPFGAYTEVDDLHNGTSEFYKNVMGRKSRRYMCFKRYKQESGEVGLPVKYWKST